MECVFACEIDKHARTTYESNFTVLSPALFSNGNFATDITKVDAATIPDFDILCAGFPCQAFSSAGLRKGFSDPRGQLFYEIIRILEAKIPKAFIIENVRNLLSHDNRKTFVTMLNALKEAGYHVQYKVLKACDFGLPQFRPRVYIVGFRENIPFTFPNPIPLQSTMSDILKGTCEKQIGYTILASHGGKSFGHKRCWDAYKVDGIVRRISVPEAKKMMGFPDSFKFPVSDIQAMRQLGNAVAVPAVEALAVELVKALELMALSTSQNIPCTSSLPLRGFQAGDFAQ